MTHHALFFAPPRNARLYQHFLWAWKIWRFERVSRRALHQIQSDPHLAKDIGIPPASDPPALPYAHLLHW